MEEKITRIIIETKGGFRFGYEKIERITKPEPRQLTHLPMPLPRGGRINYYA